VAKPVLRSLIVLPDDSPKPVVNAIKSAKKSIRVKMFALSDPRMLQALIEARGRGVKTRVILNPARPGREGRSIAAQKLLRSAGIEVLASNPAFSVTHEKSMVVDDSAAFVQSFNWEPENFSETRDYAVLTREPNEVSEVVACFEADWRRQEFKPKEGSRLIWCPWNGRERFAYFIDHAQESLVVQNERFQDTNIVERLVKTKLRGVKVHVLARPAHSLDVDNLEKLAEGVGGLQIMHDVGIKIHKLKRLKLHAKMLLADGSRAIIGSINITLGSFEKRRELAIEVVDDQILDRLQSVIDEDWKNSTPLNVSDEALAADLKRHHQEGIVSRWRSRYREPD
jgi:phosphatidylserine/phosphatidylglycerophosphate/cardiolipin synthase-like enzyme